MKYIWLLLVVIGVVGIYTGIQRFQVESTGLFGEYPCLLCASVEPDLEVFVFSQVACLNCDRAVERAQRFCRLTGITYGNTFYDDADETYEKLNELGLMWDSEVLIVILENGAVIKTSKDAATVEHFLSEAVKEALQL